MTETAGEVINDILLDLVVLGSDATMDPSETASTIRYMNRYMTMIAAQGINLGYTKVTSISDTLTIPDGASMGLIKNVVLIMAPQFGAVITAASVSAARDGLHRSATGGHCGLDHRAYGGPGIGACDLSLAG
jgi:hypothetical protein